ncbi:hypothetical protein [Actinokineospora sp.]|uniref:hypothetical protein n=1 Tax=Actinokineospora sp. TaxID=1872133 RepID=UPI0040379429
MGAPPLSPGDGGKFDFSPDEIRAIVKDWLDLAESYQTSLSTSRGLATIEGPGQEYASEMHATVANSAGRAYLDSLVEKRAYALSQAQKFQDALHDYLGVDRQNVRKITAAGESGPPPVLATDEGI